ALVLLEALERALRMARRDLGTVEEHRAIEEDAAPAPGDRGTAILQEVDATGAVAHVAHGHASADLGACEFAEATLHLDPGATAAIARSARASIESPSSSSSDRTSTVRASVAAVSNSAASRSAIQPATPRPWRGASVSRSRSSSPRQAQSVSRLFTRFRRRRS